MELPHPSSSLYPIRVDVFSEDKSLRIVDTILLDRNVWPVPVKGKEGLDANAWYMAQSCLQDAEVAGIGRTVRHFTGRLDLWSRSLLTKMHDMMLPQLQVAWRGTTGRIKGGTSIEELPTKKRSREQIDNYPTEKWVKREGGEGPKEEGIRSSSDAMDTAEYTKPVESTTEAVPQRSKAAHSQSIPLESSSVPTPVTSKGSSISSQLIPIRIRMQIHGMRIHDDLMWDPSMADVISPLTLAQSVGDDLNLTPDAVQAIAVSIAEQIHGLALAPDDKPESDEGGPQEDRSRTTAAWLLEQRVHITNVAHLVAQHRPVSTTATSSNSSNIKS